MMVDDLTLIKKIGDGAFGEVYITSKEGDNLKYASKIINKKKLRKDKYNNTSLNNEISILLDIYHPNILKIIEIKETKDKIFLVTEYYNGGTLEEYLEKNKPLSEDIVQFLMRQIIDAIKYLHNKKIVHTNISLDNIMINYEDENDRINNNIMKSKIKIIGFSLASYLKKGEYLYSITGGHINLDPICIFKLNKIPEYKYSGYDEKLDIWSLGIIFYELLIGKNPFDACSMDELVEMVIKGDFYIPITISKEAISFLNCMMRYDLKDRLSIDILYNHEFLRKNVNVFTKLEIKNKDFEPEIKLNIYSKIEEI